MCVGTEGHPGPEGPPGPPTLEALIREWVKEDPILSKHLFFTEYNEGTYIETRCDWARKLSQHRYPVNRQHTGYTLALFPPEESHDKRIMIFFHNRERASRIRGCLRREDPLFIEKLREFLVLGHDALFDKMGCKIKWEFEETLSDRDTAEIQHWWQDGVDL